MIVWGLQAWICGALVFVGVVVFVGVGLGVIAWFDDVPLFWALQSLQLLYVVNNIEVNAYTIEKELT